MDEIVMGSVASQGLRDVLESDAIVQVEGKPMFVVEFEGLVFWSHGGGKMDAWSSEIIGKSQGAAESVQAIVGQFGGTVGEVGEAE